MDYSLVFMWQVWGWCLLSVTAICSLPLSRMVIRRNKQKFAMERPDQARRYIREAEEEETNNYGVHTYHQVGGCMLLGCCKHISRINNMLTNDRAAVTVFKWPLACMSLKVPALQDACLLGWPQDKGLRIVSTSLACC